MLRYLLSLAAVVALSGCGVDEVKPESEMLDSASPIAESDSHAPISAPIVALKPDFKFVAPKIEIDYGAGLKAVDTQNITRIPCQINSIRVRYSYKNGGVIMGGAHNVRSFVMGLPSAVQPQLALAAGAVRTSALSLSLVGMPVSVPRDLTVYLDNFGAVAEQSEANNMFVGKIVKVCGIL